METAEGNKEEVKLFLPAPTQYIRLLLRAQGRAQGTQREEEGGGREGQAILLPSHLVLETEGFCGSMKRWLWGKMGSRTGGGEFSQ